MVKLNKIYTRTGDSGSAGLVDGSRVSKSSLRMAAIGDIDEANAAIGVAIAEVGEGPFRDRLLVIQNDLFDLGADAATPGEVEGALGDGTPVRFRRIRPDDKGLLQSGFQMLSPQSRYRRFFP